MRYLGEPMGRELGSPIGLGPRGFGVSYRLRDLFEDTDGVTVQAHTMNAGSGWTKRTGTDAVIDTNRAKIPNGATDPIYTADAGIADCTIRLTVRFAVVTSTSSRGIVFRYQDNSNFWMLVLTANMNRFDLYEVQAGAFTVRAGGAFTVAAATDYVLEVVLSGTGISGTVDGGNGINHTSAFLSAQTHHGFRGQAEGGDEFVDTFEVLP